MIYKSLPAFLSVFLFALSSCRQHETQLALFVPKDATSVFVIDTKAITEKINSSGIILDSLANLFNKNETGLHWNDIENSGINLENSCIFFNKELNTIQTGKVNSTAIIAAIKDKSRLENFLKRQVDKAAITSDNKYQYVDIGSGYIAGWNDEVLIISGVIKGNEKIADEMQSHKQLTTLFSLTKDNSVTSINEFTNLLNRKGDIHFWQNASGKLTALPMMSMTNIGDLFEGTYTTGTIDFEKGKIIATTQSNINKKLADILNKYPSKEIDRGMIAKFPGDINGFGIISFNPKLLTDILQYSGFDIMANGYVSQMGFSVDDVMNAFSGDIAFIASDMFVNQNNLPGINNMDEYKKGNYLLIMRIGDRPAFDRMMVGLVNAKILSKNGDAYQLGLFGGHDFIIETNNDALFIGSGDELIKSYEAGNAKSNLPDAIDKEIKNKSMAIYVDIKAMFNKSTATDISGKKALALAQATFKNFISTADKSDGKTIKGNFILNFVNTNDNSLASLAKFIAAARIEELKHKKGWTAYPPLSRVHDEDSLPAPNNAQ